MDQSQPRSIPHSDPGGVCQQAGQVLLIVVLLIAVLLALVGLAVDSAMLYVKQAKLQSKADAAALAGVSMLPDADAARQAAELYVRLNEIEPQTSIQVQVSQGEQQETGSVTVLLTQQVPLSFLSILGIDSAGVSAEATANQTSSVADLVLALDSAGCNKAGQARVCSDIRESAEILAEAILDQGGQIGIVDYDHSAQIVLSPTTDQEQVMQALEKWGVGEKKVREYNPGDAVWLAASALRSMSGDRPRGVVLIASGDADHGRNCCSECKCGADQLAECGKKCDYERCCARWAQQAAYYAWSQGAFVVTVDGTGKKQGTELMQSMADLGDDGQMNGTDLYYVLVGSRVNKKPRPGDYQRAMEDVIERLPGGGQGARLVR